MADTASELLGLSRISAMASTIPSPSAAQAHDRTTTIIADGIGIAPPTSNTSADIVGDFDDVPSDPTATATSATTSAAAAITATTSAATVVTAATSAAGAVAATAVNDIPPVKKGRKWTPGVAINATSV